MHSDFDRDIHEVARCTLVVSNQRVVRDEDPATMGRPYYATTTVFVTAADWPWRVTATIDTL